MAADQNQFWTVFSAIATSVVAVGTLIASAVALYLGVLQTRGKVKIIAGPTFDVKEHKRYFIQVTNAGPKSIAISSMNWIIRPWFRKGVIIPHIDWIASIGDARKLRLKPGESTPPYFITAPVVRELIMGLEELSEKYVQDRTLRRTRILFFASSGQRFTCKVDPDLRELMQFEARFLR